MVTRFQAIKNLEPYIGKDLFEIAIDLGITIEKEGKSNKGWKGHTLERLAGLTASSKQAPNGLGFELKSVAFVRKGSTWVPKETMAITMITPEHVIETPFFFSHCWEKLKKLVFCAVSWEGHFSRTSTLVEVSSFDFNSSLELVKEIEADYEFIRDTLISRGFEHLSGRMGKWIQPRTKGQGHGSTSRAFYARKNLVSIIFENKNN